MIADQEDREIWTSPDIGKPRLTAEAQGAVDLVIGLIRGQAAGHIPIASRVAMRSITAEDAQGRANPNVLREELR
jgi:hypothetical protein